MGGKPLTALNIVTFPVGQLDISILRETLRGGLDKMHEAGVVLVGGHSVDDPEMKYGLSVTGTIHPDRVVLNTGAHPGDRLLLTKPLGTGIIATATKRGAASPAAIAAATESMSRLNDRAATAMLEVGVHAATDITGFGLLGHATEMLGKSQLCLKIESAALPLLPDAAKLAQEGYLAGGVKRNRDYYAAGVEIDPGVPTHLQDLLYDPQTSGGLLIAVAADKADSLLEKMQTAGIAEAAIIGEVVATTARCISIV
jgi:selenide, water dikinase